MTALGWDVEAEISTAPLFFSPGVLLVCASHVTGRAAFYFWHSNPSLAQRFFIYFMSWILLGEFCTASHQMVAQGSPEI